MVEIKLNDYEAFRAGMNMEKKGMDFYARYAGIVKGQATREIMLKLAEDENEHYELFKSLAEEVGGGYAGQPLVNDQLIKEYLEALVDPCIFIEPPAEMDELDALDYALAAEKNSMLFYYDAYQYATTESGKKAFQRLAIEERKHFVAIKKRIDELK